MKYAQVTIPFGVPKGLLDFKIVAAGKTCSAPALAEKIGVDIAAEVVTTLVYMGTTNDATLMATVDKSTTNVPQNRSMRFINTIPGTQIEWGAGGNKELPAQLSTPYFNKPMAYGQIPKIGDSANAAFVIDTVGYLTTLNSSVPTGAASVGSKDMLLLHVLDGAKFWTYYAIGSTASGSAYPVRGLICKDDGIADTLTIQDCEVSAVETYRVDVVNAGLYGAFAAVEGERGAAVIQKLAQRGTVSDFLCASEVSRHDDLVLPDGQKDYTQEALERAALAVDNGFKYFARAYTDLDTPADDTVDQNGEIPPPVTRIPCSAPVKPETADLVYKCLLERCNSLPNSNPEGVTAGGTNCYSEKCGPSALGFLLFGSPEDNQCFQCIVLNGLSYMPWGKIRTRCATEGRRPMAFEGRPTSMLLSRFPIKSTEKFVVPTSAFRRVALHSIVDLGLSKELDVYCVHAPPLLGSNMPYTGPYGNGLPATDGRAWSEEQEWTTKKIINWINKTSEGRPALILGDWSSSATFLNANGEVVNGPDNLPAVADVTAGTMRAVEEAFTPAVPVGYFPRCTRCPATRTDELRNVYNKNTTDPMWNVRVFIKKPWGTNLTESAGIFFHEPTDYVTYTQLTDFGPAGPVSDTWGFHANIRR
ncbi:MAG: hypothetical protein ABW133_13725 [Polyangiaceae bacterium]